MDTIFSSFIEDILKRVSSDYKISLVDLKNKYLNEKQNVEPISLSKMKKSDLVRECKHYGIDTNGSVIELKERVKTSRAKSGIKAVRGNKKKAVKKTTPLHNHPVCEEIYKKCTLCQSHGNVMCSKEIEYEIV